MRVQHGTTSGWGNSAWINVSVKRGEMHTAYRRPWRFNRNTKLGCVGAGNQPKADQGAEVRGRFALLRSQLYFALGAALNSSAVSSLTVPSCRRTHPPS